MARTNTREEIIRRGADLIHAQGFNATGLQQILQAAGIPKGSFYFYFRSKDHFGLEIIDYFGTQIGDVFSRFLQDQNAPPLVRLENLLDYFESLFEKNGCGLGCPIGNLALELADTNDSLRLKLREIVEGLIARIEACLEEARRAETLAGGISPSDAARFIFHGFEGAVMNMKLARSLEPFRIFRLCIRQYLGGAATARKAVS